MISKFRSRFITCSAPIFNGFGIIRFYFIYNQKSIGDPFIPTLDR
jgi:hypothetical protein